MATVLEQLHPYLVDLAVSVIAVLGGVLVHRAKRWLDGLSEDRRWRAAVAKLDTAATAGMAAAEQTIASRLRAIEPVGRLDARQGAQVLEEALAAARLHLGPAVWLDIGRTLELTPDRLVELLRTRIEAAVHRSKVGTAIKLDPFVTATIGPDDPTVRANVSEIADGPA